MAGLSIGWKGKKKICSGADWFNSSNDVDDDDVDVDDGNCFCFEEWWCKCVIIIIINS